MLSLPRPHTQLALLAGALTAIAWLALAGVADGYASHGWNARWYTRHEGRRELVTRTIEHRVAFPNAHRPLARYVQGWPFERLPVPRELPAIDAELRAMVTIPPGPPRYLGADARQDVEVLVDGHRASEALLEPGEHQVLVVWRGRPPVNVRTRPNADAVRFALTWGPTPSSLESVPREAITPLSGAWTGTRVALWWIAVVLALLFGAGAFLAAHAHDPRARRRRGAVLATALLVLVGTAYRAFDYDVMPEFRENADELFATWNGWSLLEDGTTRGWSLWPHAYDSTVERTELRYFGETRIVIRPYFEHPPLLHLLAGAAAHLGGAEHWLEAKLAHARLVPIALSALSLVLLIAVGRRLSPASPAPWLGALLYAVLPIVALQTRVIKEEALLVPLALGMALFFLRWRDDGRRTRDLVLAAACAGLAPLAKVPAIVWVPSLAMLIAAERGELKRATWAAAIGVAIASLWLAFGALIDWDVFLVTQAHQGGRPTHWGVFLRFFDATLINHNLVGRGWILFLWLAFAVSVLRRGRRDAAVLTVPLVTYLVAIAVGSGNWTFGWYMVPLYPFLCLGAGDMLAGLWRRPTLFGGALVVVLLVMYGLSFTLDPAWAMQPEAWPSLRRALTILVALSIAPYALGQVWPRSAARGLARAATVVALAAVVALSGYFVARYDTIYETHRDFDRHLWFRDRPW